MLSKVDILSMKPGPELDNLVAQYVFGRDILPSGGIWNGASGYNVPAYSTDIKDAWLVIEAMINQGFYYRLGDGMHRSKDINVQDCLFTNGKLTEQVWGVSAPDAICRAALLIVFGQNKMLR